MAKQTYIGSIKTQRFKLNWKAIVGILVGVVCLGVALFVLHTHQKSQKTKATATAYKKATDSTDEYIQQGKTGAAEQNLQNFVKDNPDQNKEQVEGAATRLSSINYNQGDFKEATRYAEIAIQNSQSPTYDMYMQLGKAAARAGENAKAIDAYKKAIKLAGDPSDPTAAAKISYLNSVIKILEKEQTK